MSINEADLDSAASVFSLAKPWHIEQPFWSKRTRTVGYLRGSRRPKGMMKATARALRGSERRQVRDQLRRAAIAGTTDPVDVEQPGTRTVGYLRGSATQFSISGLFSISCGSADSNNVLSMTINCSLLVYGQNLYFRYAVNGRIVSNRNDNPQNYIGYKSWKSSREQ